MLFKTAEEIYLDANATTPVLPQAAKAAYEAMQDLFGNPSSSHTSGLRAREILESARRLAQSVLGVTSDQGQIIFTSGATEAIQLGIFSCLCQLKEQRGQFNPPATTTTHRNSWEPLTADLVNEPSEVNSPKRFLLYGATEHKAVPQALQHWNRLLCFGAEVMAIPVDRQGQLDLDFLRQHAPLADMVCTMAINNETGVITDLKEVEAAIRKANPDVLWMVDSVQAIGKIDMQLGSTTIDYAPLSGHKIYAPKGIGILYARKSAPIVPLMAGGGQEHGARGGTENLPGVAAIAAVLQQLTNSPSRCFNDQQTLDEYRQRLIDQLKTTFPSMMLNAPLETSAPTTINFSVQGFSSKELLDLFDAAGIRVSSGSACGSEVVGSYVLEAMGLPRWQSEGAIRLSFGPLVTSAEIDSACQQIEQVGFALCESCLVVAPQASVDRRPIDGLVQLKNGSTCTWLLFDANSARCLIIDPLPELAQRIASLVRCQESRAIAILDTHAHLDHHSCRTELLTELGSLALPSAHSDDLLGWPQRPDGTVELADQTIAPYLQFGNKVLAQTELPGHTKISSAYLFGQVNEGKLNGRLDGAPIRMAQSDVEFAFLGDTILMGGLGRSDFPTSVPDKMYDSLKRIFRLINPRTIICPTHDYTHGFATCLDAERSQNELLNRVLSESGIDQNEFLIRKREMDGLITQSDSDSISEVICGHVSDAIDESVGDLLEVPKHGLQELLARQPNVLIVDVREPHEFVFTLDWQAVGFSCPPISIPLTRLTGKIPRLQQLSENGERTILFLCRSGKRSSKAAEVAWRNGIRSVGHVAGGLALHTSIRSLAQTSQTDVGYVI